MHRDLKLSENDICVHKGEDENIDSYSGFGNGEYKTLLHSIVTFFNILVIKSLSKNSIYLWVSLRLLCAIHSNWCIKTRI